MWWMYVVAAAILALFFHASNVLYLRMHVSGTLKADRSDPDRDVYRLEIDDFESFDKSKYVVLRVDNNANLSQQ